MVVKKIATGHYAKIEKGAKVQYAMIAENAVVKSGAVVGEDPQDYEDRAKWGVAVVGPNLTIGENAKVKAQTMVVENVEGGAEV